MRFAFVTDELPRSGLSGHLALNHGIIEWLLSGGHEVTILLTRPRLNWPVERYAVADVTGPALKTFGDFVFTISPRAICAILALKILGRLPNGLAAILQRRTRARRYGKVDAVLGAFITPLQSTWCAARIQRMAPDAVLVDTIFRAPLLREPGLQNFNSVIGAPDIFFRRHQAMLAAGYKVYPPQLPRRMEAALLSSAKAIAAIQPEEATEIGVMCPRQFVCLATPSALPCPPQPGQGKYPGRLIFIGSDTLPNIDGLRWFFAEAWPCLRKLYPSATLDLVGDCGAALAHLPAGVQRLGRIKDLSIILHRSTLAIAPLRVSSGLKIKILDYARHGLMTVMTPESQRGFIADANAPFIVAGDGAAFGRAVAAKLAEPDPMDTQRALDYVARHYNADVSFSSLATALHITP